MSLRNLAAAAATVSIMLLPQSVQARQITLEVASSLELTNPNDAGDVVRLYKFDFPGSLSDKVVVRAYLEISGIETDEVPLKLEALQAAFTQQTTWNSFAQARAQVIADETALVEAATSGDTAANLTKIVRSWVTGEASNYGVAITGLPASGIDSAEALDNLAEPPLLHIVYTQDTED
jgi:hypothetical protein